MKDDPLDALDRRILNEVQRDAKQTMHVLAERVASSPATCHRRLSRLEAAGFVAQTVALVEPARSREPITAILGLTLSDQAKPRQDLVKDFLREQPAVRLAWMTTGEFDYIVVCAFPDVPALGRFVDTVISSDERFQRYTTFLSIEDLKFETLRRF